MKIGFDAKRAAQNGTGLGNYSRFIISTLVQNDSEATCSLYVPNRKKAGLLGRLPQTKSICTVFPPHGFWSYFPSLWRTFGVTYRLKKDGIDLYHGLSNELPLNIKKANGIKTIVTIHDLLFLRFPQGYNAIDRFIYNYKFKKACQKADHIIAVSEFTKREIIEQYGISSKKITVVYQGCDSSFRKKASKKQLADVKLKYQLPSRYILYIGSIEKRKNLMLLAQALKKLPKDTNVIAIGRRTPYADKVESYLKANGINHQMRILSGVPFNELPAIYQQATLFVYPSRCEGFGIPLLEALCSGVPAIGCTGSCLEEAGGPDSAYVNPDSPEELAQAINDILLAPKRREQMASKGLLYADQFKDELLCRKLINVYKQVLSTT